MQNSGMMSIFGHGSEAVNGSASAVQMTWSPAVDRSDSDTGMTIATESGEISLGTSQVRDLFRFLLDHSREFEQVCCWNGCRAQGKPYQVKRTHLNANRFYCDRHAFSAELAGFVVVPLFSGKGRD
jgi:hypothetical protein